MIIFETKRLKLRNFIKEDYDDLYEFLSQRKDDFYEGYQGITYDNGIEHLSYRLNNDEFIAIELKDSKKVIGNVYLGNRENNVKEIGYIINKDYQRKGYAYEAITTILEDAFSKGVKKIYAECDPNNICSWQLLDKLNFTKIAFFEKNVFFHKDENNQPIWQDTCVYEIKRKSEED